MDRKELIIAGIIVILAVVIGSIIFTPGNDVHGTGLTILNKGDIGENATLYVKLTDNGKNSLNNKQINVKITDKKGKVVYDESVKTHFTGVAIIKLSNVSDGTYNCDISFDGDENYTQSSFSKKITINRTATDDLIDNSTVDDTQDSSDDDATEDSEDSYDYSTSQSNSYQSSSYSQPSSDSQSTTQDSSNDDSNNVVDENGNEVDTYDENGKPVDPTKSD